jgi:hypothetical protein
MSTSIQKSYEAVSFSSIRNNTGVDINNKSLKSIPGYIWTDEPDDGVVVVLHMNWMMINEQSHQHPILNKHKSDLGGINILC